MLKLLSVGIPETYKKLVSDVPDVVLLVISII